MNYGFYLGTSPDELCDEELCDHREFCAFNNLKEPSSPGVLFGHLKVKFGLNGNNRLAVV